MTFSITREDLGVSEVPGTDAYAVAAQLVILAAEEVRQGTVADALLVAATVHNEQSAEQGVEFLLEAAEALARLAAHYLVQVDGQ